MATNESEWSQLLLEAINSDESLKHRCLIGPGGKWIEITPADSKMDVLLGPVDEARMTVSLATRVYQLYVLYPIPRPVEQYVGVTSEDTFATVIDLISKKGGYVLCPGLKPSFYEDKLTTIGYDREGIRIFNFPIKRYEARKCLLWHLPTNKRTPIGHDLHNVCTECKKEAKRATANAERAILVSEEEKEQRLNPTSKYPLLKLSPKSQAERISRLKKECAGFQQKLSRFIETTSVDVTGDESLEMSDVILHINKNPPALHQLESVLTEAEPQGCRDLLEGIWVTDTSNLSERIQFFEDQFTNTMGRKKMGNRWSMVTFRIALAIYVRSPSAFEAVKSLNILQLPSKRTLESFTSANIHQPGVSNEYLCEQWRNYQQHCSKIENEGKPKPVAEGLLIFDEVKVQNGVCWHSKTNRIVGLAMIRDHLTSLSDVYQQLKEDKAKKTTYILQFMWRDLSSKFDLIGPYYTSECGLDSRFTTACLFEVMQAMESTGFQIHALICDGASWNLTMLKHLCGAVGKFGCGEMTDPERYGVLCSFKNPFSDNNVWIIICPSHQLKNMISALHSSKSGKTKSFCCQGTSFGWVTVERMWRREIQRAESGLMCEVPQLKDRYIKRDSWTRLNVAPAKIMQQDKVIDEIERYGAPHNKDDKMTLQYLKALRKIFERGLLCREHVTSMESRVVVSMIEGYRFFTEWC